jgi:hypothetical protein
MSRVIIFGNSHVGSLKTAWNKARMQHRNASVDFFAAPAGGCFDELRFLTGREFGLPRESAKAYPRINEVVMTINGRSSVDFGAADHVVWAGYSWPAAQIARMIADFDIDGLREADAPKRMSFAVLSAFLEDLAESTLPGLEWRGWNGPNLMISLAPMPAETILTIKPNGPWTTLCADPTGVANVFDLFFEKLEHSASRAGIGMIGPVRQALLANRLTQSGFTRNSRRLYQNVPHPEHDTAHMNASYGMLWFDELFVTIDRQSGARQPALCG